MRKLCPDARLHYNSDTAKHRRALLKSCALCGVELAHGPIRKDCNRRLPRLFFFALASSLAGSAIAIKSKTHKRPLGISLLRVLPITSHTTLKDSREREHFSNW